METTNLTGLNGDGVKVTALVELREKQREEAEREYLELLAIQGKPTVAQVAKIAKTMEVLGYTDADFAEHLRIRHEYKKDATIAAELSRLMGIAQQADKSLNSYRQETAEIINKRNAEALAMQEAVIAAAGKANQAGSAFDRNKKREREHWMILGIQNPSIKPTVVEIILARRDTPIREGQVSIQSIIASPRSRGNPFELQVKAAEGQDPAQSAQWHEVWKSLYSGRLEGARFIVAKGFSTEEFSITYVEHPLPIFTQIDDACAFYGELEPPDRIEQLNRSLDTFAMLNPPGQSDEDYEKLLKKIQTTESSRDRRRKIRNSQYRGDEENFDQWERERGSFADQQRMAASQRI